MFQLSKNVNTDFLGQIFRELFQSETRPVFGTLVKMHRQRQKRVESDIKSTFLMNSFLILFKS